MSSVHEYYLLHRNDTVLMFPQFQQYEVYVVEYPDDITSFIRNIKYGIFRQMFTAEKRQYLENGKMIKVTAHDIIKIVDANIEMYVDAIEEEIAKQEKGEINET